MLQYSFDDLHIVNRCPEFTENVDYASNTNQLDDYSLYQCWKQNSNPNREDISTIIPSSISRRLENICWRRWTKYLKKLGEVAPWTIDWNKDHDITWLYGPKFEKYDGFSLENTSMLTISNLKQIDSGKSYDCNESLLSSSLNSSSSLMSYAGSIDTTSSIDSQNQHSSLRSAMKSCSLTKRKRNVHFNHQIYSREYYNGRMIDYGYLDNSFY